MKRQSYPRWLLQKTVACFKAIKTGFPEYIPAIELFGGGILLLLTVVVIGPIAITELGIYGHFLLLTLVVFAFLLTTHGWYKGEEDC